MKEEFVFILDVFRVPPFSLLKSSFTTLQALSVTFTRRLDGPCYTLYLQHPSSLNWKWVTFVTFSLHHSFLPTFRPRDWTPFLLIMRHSTVNMGQVKRRPFSPQFFEMKMTSSSYPKFLSLSFCLRKRSPFFIDFIPSRCSSCIVFCFFKEGGGDAR